MKDIRVSDSRSLLEGFFVMNGMSGKSDEIIAAIADIDCAGEETVRQRLISDVKMLPCKAETLLDFLSDKGSAEDTLFALEQYRGIVPEYDMALDELLSDK